jgi:putative membrane protein
MHVLLDWLILSFAVWLTARFLPGFHVNGFGDAIWVAALFGILNFLIGWLFFVVFTVFTLGIAFLLAFITRWIIDAIILQIVASMSDSLNIDGFRWALGGALMMSLLGTAMQWLLH